MKASFFFPFNFNFNFQKKDFSFLFFFFNFNFNFEKKIVTPNTITTSNLRKNTTSVN